MKKNYLIALSAIGLCVCLNFSSCSKDDKDEPSTPEASVKMRPVSIKKSNGNSFSNITYNDGLQVNSYTKTSWNGSSNYEYKYNNDEIIVTCTDSNNEETIYTYSLSNGKIVSANPGEYSDSEIYEYDGNTLIRVTMDDNIWKEIISYKWQNGNITQETWTEIVSEESDLLKSSYSYTNNPMYVWIRVGNGNDEETYEPCDPFLVRQGYFGKTPKNWKEEISCSWDGAVYSYDYQFNENGYPTKIIQTFDSDYTTEVVTVEIEWEKY